MSENNINYYKFFNRVTKSSNVSHNNNYQLHRFRWSDARKNERKSRVTNFERRLEEYKNKRELDGNRRRSNMLNALKTGTLQIKTIKTENIPKQESYLISKLKDVFLKEPSVAEYFIKLILPHKCQMIQNKVFIERVYVSEDSAFGNMFVENYSSKTHIPGRSFENADLLIQENLTAKEKARILMYLNIKPKEIPSSGQKFIPVTYIQKASIPNNNITLFYKPLYNTIITNFLGVFSFSKLIRQSMMKYKSEILTYGRIKPLNGLGYCSISRKTRPQLFYGMVEIDIVNCHPTIIFEIIKMLKLDMPAITDYINKREFYIKELSLYYFRGIDDYKTKRDSIKNLLLTLMYVNYTDKWKEIFHVDTTIQDPQFIRDYIVEMRYFRQIINYFCGGYANIATAKGYKPNPFSSAFSYFLQNIEIQILEHMYMSLKEQGVIKTETVNIYGTNKTETGDLCTFCHDGLLVPIENLPVDPVGQTDVLNKINDRIQEHLLIDVKFEIKTPKLKIITNVAGNQ